MRVWHYDGVSALRREPDLVADGDAFVLVESDRSEGPYRFADLVARDTVDGNRPVVTAAVVP